MTGQKQSIESHLPQERVDCLIPEFTVPNPFEQDKAQDGATFLSETVADHIAFKIVLKAWRNLTSQSKPSLPGLSWLMPKQLAFVTLAYSRCSALSSSVLKVIFRGNDPHPLNFIRMNRGVGHSPEFMRVFNCTKEHRLHREKQCKIFD